MFAYYLGLALRSLRQSPVLTGLIVLAIALGIGASMTMLTVLHVMAGDPLPARSARLFTPHLDPLPLKFHRAEGAPDPSASLSWPDAMALLEAHRGERQAAMTGGRLLILPQRQVHQTFYANGRYTTADFFAMFGVPFEGGGGWTTADDEASAHVVVLNETLARKLFGSQDAIGRSVWLGDHDFRVVGITADWAPKPLFYADASAKRYSDKDQFFLPLSAAVDLKLQVTGNISSWGVFNGDLHTPSASWLQFWVQLNNSKEVAKYRTFLLNYSAQQKALGRFERPATNAKLYTLMGWLQHQRLIPNDVRLQFWLALGFLFVCMINTVALLLAKFLRRKGEIGVRRAMGARRCDIFVQLGMESALIGVAGGVLGLAVAQFGLWGVRQRPDDFAHLAQMDVTMLFGTLALAITACVLAGLLPAWRASRVQPSLLLKSL